MRSAGGKWMAFCAVLALSAPALAADLVVLTNGNRMPGTLRDLSRGQLIFSIEGAGRGKGRVEIDWRSVAMLESLQRLDIELASGERYLGTIAARGNGTIEVTTDAGTKSIAMTDIVRITPIEATFRDRTRGSLDVGLDVLSASNEIDWTLNGEAHNRTKHYLTEVSLSSLVRRHDSETTQQR